MLFQHESSELPEESPINPVSKWSYSALLNLFLLHPSYREEGPESEGADRGREAIPVGRLQHSGGDVRWRGGPGHRRGRPHRLLRRLQVAHTARPEDGEDGEEEGGQDHRPGHRGEMRLLHT